MNNPSQRLMLTHFGHRRLLALRKARVPHDEDSMLLAEIAEQGVLDEKMTEQVERLIASGWLARAQPECSAQDALLRYKRNPLEHVERINFEVTTQCNFNCLHCRNGDAKATREKDMLSLEDAGRLFLTLGMRCFDFIGGEVTRYGNGWLALAQALRRYDQTLGWPEPLAVTVITNGWWLGEKDFTAAGKKYSGEAEYLADLKAHGVTHVLFSIDGPPQRHDEWRGHPGLFNRILKGIPRVKAAGLAPRLSIITHGHESHEYLRPLTNAIYDDWVDTLDAFAGDQMNLVSNFIDCGRAAENLRQGKHTLAELTPGMIRCKAFFRPSPTLRIMADGSLGICPLMLGEEGYGNIHDHPLVDILNRMDEAPLYRLHADGEIGQYLEKINPDTFADGFDHLCAVRIIINRRALSDLGISVGAPD